MSGIDKMLGICIELIHRAKKKNPLQGDAEDSEPEFEEMLIPSAEDTVNPGIPQQADGLTTTSAGGRQTVDWWHEDDKSTSAYEDLVFDNMSEPDDGFETDDAEYDKYDPDDRYGQDLPSKIQDCSKVTPPRQAGI